MTLSFPPFTKAVIWLIGINTAIYLLYLALSVAGLHVAGFLLDYLALSPNSVVRPRVAVADRDLRLSAP